MRAERLIARGFRNLTDLDCALPPAGLALLGRNGQGKTNFLEALYYPVLFRSLRGAADAELAGFGGPGFHVEVCVADGERPRGRSVAATSVAATWQLAGRRKRPVVDGDEPPRVADAIGRWLAVAFLPADVALAAGPAAERRQYLDRMLSLADRAYLAALMRFRAAVAQRNGALRQGRADVARAFDDAMAAAGAVVVAARLHWMAEAADRFAEECERFEERAPARLVYRGHAELAEREAWPAALARALPHDLARGMTTLGPHRDDVVLELGGRPLRRFGSTGQQRSAAVALKLLEIGTLRERCGTDPALLLDDVFAELDRGRQARLAERLLVPGRQVFLTAPRRDELPDGVAVPVWEVEGGVVRGA